MSATRESQPPKVSVLILAFNHAPFIERAVQGALDQKTDFVYEVVIGEDCSTDNTRQLVAAVARRQPERIRALLHDARLGMCGNLERTLHACRGEYVALLDGDDFWIAPDKLQKQADVLDRHPELAISFHNALAVHQAGEAAPFLFNDKQQKRISTLEDLWSGNFIATCSVMLRRRLIAALPDWYAALPFGDWPLWILASEGGSIGYIDEVMAVYRIHDGGVWSGRSERMQIEQVIDFYDQMNVNLDFRYDEIIQRLIARNRDALTRAGG